MVMIDIDAENGYRTHSLHLPSVTIASFVFENTDAKWEWAFTFLHDVTYDVDALGIKFIWGVST